MELPDGFEFHEGLDGLILGIGIVFFVKVQRAVRMWLDWRLIPKWVYEPIDDFFTGLVEGLMGMGSSISGPSFVGGGSGGATAGSSAGGAGAAGLLNTPILGSVLKLTGLPILLFDAFSASAVEQLLIVVGWWIAVLVPLRWWLLRPTLFWWQGRRTKG